MKGPPRRDVLKATAALLPLGAAGCLSRSDAAGARGGSTTDDPTTDSGGATTDARTTAPGTSAEGVAHYGFDAPGNATHPDGGSSVVLEYDPDAGYAQRLAGGYHLAVFSTGEAASALDPVVAHDEGAREFVAATDFETASLVVLQDRGASSSPDLAVDAVTDHGGWVELDVRYPGRGATADVATETLLVRVAGDPAHATATLTPQYGERVTLSTVGRYGRPALDEARSVVLRNRDCSDHSLSVRVTAGGELIHARSYAVAAGATQRLRDVLTRAGSYEVTVTTGGEDGDGASTTWEATNDGTARHALARLDGEGALSLSLVEAVPDAGFGCSASDLPYESSNPSENVRDPERVTWVNRSDEAREATVAVDAGDRRVYEETHELAAGSKGRTPPLLAKRGTYTLAVDPGSGDATTAEWVVSADDGSDDGATILVDADGRLRVDA